MKTLLLACLIPFVSHAAAPAPPAPAAPTNWYDDFILKDRSMEFEMIRTLGYAVSGAADIGEVISTARLIKDGDIDSWAKEWQRVADRLHALAVQFDGKGQKVSAKEAYFRASNYYRTACFYLGAKKDRAKCIDIWEKSVDAFRKGISSEPLVSLVHIPYQKTTLPGYLLKSKTPKAPLVIIQTGFDGTAEELYFEAGIAAYQRGYNVLLFEGPGQGEVIKKQNLPFRYDWENVVTPVVDFAMQLDFIDQKKISLIGISMGGYLAARAAAFEHRIAACVLNGGIFDFSENIYQSMPKEVTNMLKGNTSGFNQAITSEMARSVNINWFFNNAMWTMQIETPAEVMKTLKQYTLKGIAEKITCPTLVVDSEDDLFLKGQPQKVFDQLKCPKTLLKFTPETTAQAHCQMGAIMISNESIFNWLDQTLGWTTLSAK